jgi:hypothetical protein
MRGETTSYIEFHSLVIEPYISMNIIHMRIIGITLSQIEL